MSAPLVKVLCGGDGGRCTRVIAVVKPTNEAGATLEEIPRRHSGPRGSHLAGDPPRPGQMEGTVGFSEFLYYDSPVEVSTSCRCPKHGWRHVDEVALANAVRDARSGAVTAPVRLVTTAGA